MTKTANTLYCVCGSVADIQRAQIMNDSDLWACWVECRSCGRKGLPAILTKDAVWYWEHDKQLIRNKEDD
jgi:hypothetical protein